jgi:hypothetical protein
MTYEHPYTWRMKIHNKRTACLPINGAVVVALAGAAAVVPINGAVVVALAGAAAVVLRLLTLLRRG